MGLELRDSFTTCRSKPEHVHSSMAKGELNNSGDVWMVAWCPLEPCQTVGVPIIWRRFLPLLSRPADGDESERLTKIWAWIRKFCVDPNARPCPQSTPNFWLGSSRLQPKKTLIHRSWFEFLIYFGLLILNRNCCSMSITKQIYVSYTSVFVFVFIPYNPCHI